MITVDTLSILNKLKLMEEGETAFVNKEQKIYKYTNGEWVEQSVPEGKMNISVYDMNKQLIAQQSPIEDIALLTPVRKFKNKGGKYFMLICRDIGYYTLFVVDPDGENRIEQEVLMCAKDVGVIKAVEEIEGTESMEIWVQPEGEDPVVMYFFNYDKGVIQCH